MKKNIFKKIIFISVFGFILLVGNLAFAGNLNVDTSLVKLNYLVGESLDISGLVITGEDGIAIPISAENITGFDSSSALSNQILTVTIGGETFDYKINIAQKPVNINLKIYAEDKVLFSGDKLVTACVESPEINSPMTVSGKCAVEQIFPALSNTWTWDYSPSGFLDELDGFKTTEDWSKSWGWFSNLEFGQTGLNKHQLSEGEELLLTYDSYPLRIKASKTSLNVGETVVFTAEEEILDSNYNMAWSVSSGVIITAGDQSCITSSEGTCSIVVNEIGSFDSTATKSLRVSTNSVEINVSSNSRKINLKIYAGDKVVFDGDEVVTACAESPEIDTLKTFNAKCAIEQLPIELKISSTWSWSDFDGDGKKTDGFLDELDGFKTTEDWSKSWGWFSNLEFGQTGLNKHQLSEGEELLLTYDSYPLRIKASKTSLNVGETVVFTSEEESTYNNNPPYGMLWTSSPSVRVSMGDQFCVTNLDGVCSIVVNKTGSYKVVGDKLLYVPSNNININVTYSGSSGGSSNSNSSQKVFDVSLALNFLNNNKKGDGSYGSDMYTDWVAIAAGAGNNSNLKSNLINYLKQNSIDSSVITDYERRAMALMSLGINPYTGTDIDYIEKIIKSFDGTQIGDIYLVNDDIFALIVLKNAGYNENDEVIKKTINYLISKQSSDGSWGSVDITSAAIQSLKGFENVSGVSQSISLANNNLVSNQQNDGGFNNSFSTSWVLQALYDDSNILKAKDYISEKQQTDGGMENITEQIENRIWSTAYAIPAILHKSWGNILNNFSKQIVADSSKYVEVEVKLDEIKTDEKKTETIIFVEKNDIKDINQSKPKVKSSTSKNSKVIKLEKIEANNSLQGEELISQNNTLTDSKISIIGHIWNILKACFEWLFVRLSF
jgi:hypothetical protein